MSDQVEITRTERARIEALQNAVRRTSSDEKSADDIVEDADKFFAFLTKEG